MAEAPCPATSTQPIEAPTPPWVRTAEYTKENGRSAHAAADAKRAEAERKPIAEAEKIVAIWNARQAGGRALWFYPTIGAAIAAGLPWLRFSWPGVRAVRFCRPAHTRPAPGRINLKPHPVGLVPPVLAQCTVRETRNADGGTAVMCVAFKSSSAARR
jgi:hypothetical protein